MPVMNGQEAFFRLREINPQCPILVISGNVGDIDINRLFEQGLNGFLNKPYRMHELSKMINDIMDSRQTQHI